VHVSLRDVREERKVGRKKNIFFFFFFGGGGRKGERGYDAMGRKAGKEERGTYYCVAFATVVCVASQICTARAVAAVGLTSCTGRCQ
jgi:hypothetical protein